MDPRTPPDLPAGTVVRRSRPDDVDAFVDLLEAVAGEGRFIGRELPLDRADRHREFLAHLDDPDDHLSLVATRHDEVVGSLGLAHDGMGHAALGMLLAADARGQGLGSALLVEAVAWADAHPVIHKVTLQAWPHNVGALALYRTHGFLVEGHLHRHWRRRDGELWDAVLMGLAVTDRTGPDHP